MFLLDWLDKRIEAKIDERIVKLDSCVHDFTNWTDPEDKESSYHSLTGGLITSTRLIQSRHCLKCNKAQVNVVL